jgi:hypothetical protein
VNVNGCVQVSTTGPMGSGGMTMKVFSSIADIESAIRRHACYEIDKVTPPWIHSAVPLWARAPEVTITVSDGLACWCEMGINGEIMGHPWKHHPSATALGLIRAADALRESCATDTSFRDNVCHLGGASVSFFRSDDTSAVAIDMEVTNLAHAIRAHAIRSGLGSDDVRSAYPHSAVMIHKAEDGREAWGWRGSEGRFREDLHMYGTPRSRKYVLPHHSAQVRAADQIIKTIRAQNTDDLYEQLV